MLLKIPRSKFAIAVIAATAFLALSVQAADKAKPVEMMVLGVYHFGNPGLDTHNMKADSVLAPKRQAELDAVARAILAFKPTHVMVERQSDAPNLALADYNKFTMADLLRDENEIAQLGYRVARMANLTAVYGIDEQPKKDEPDYYPYDKLQATAKQFGQTAVLEQLNAPIGEMVKAFEQAQKTATVGQLLLQMNGPKMQSAMVNSYFNMLPIGDIETQTGADLNAMWYLRNAKIFGKALKIAKPGDRVFVVYGAGHVYWLRHFASHMPGYKSVDPQPYLLKAK
jgi:Family of unknown function (DUF5694)